MKPVSPGGPDGGHRDGGPPRVSDVSRAHAGRRVHHSGVGDRPDPRASPDPRRARGALLAAEPPIDAAAGCVTRPTPVRRRPSCHLSAAPRPATTRRGPFAWSAVPPERLIGPRRHRPPHGDRRSHGPRGALARRRARRRPSCSRGRRSRRTLDRPQSKFLS